MKTGFSLQSADAALVRIPAPRFLWAMPVAINTSLYAYPAEIWEQIPDKDIIIKLTILIPIVLFGILGNVVLLEIIFSNRSLRTATHLLIANLALIDLVTLLLCPPMFLLHDIHQSYVLGSVGCKLEGFIEGGLLITSVLALCVVSYDRLAAIVLPSKARLKNTSVAVATGLCWLVGFAAALPFAIYRNYRERNWSNFHETFCAEDRQVMPLYWDLIVVLLVWLPLGVMLVTYSAILCKLDHYERSALNREHPMVVRYKSRVAKTLFVVLMSFVVVRIPFTIMIMVYYKDVNDGNTFEVSEGFVMVWWFAKVAFIFLYSAVNPVIYGMTNRTFRKAFKSSRILSMICRFEEKQNPDKPPKGRILTFSRKMLWPREPCVDDQNNEEKFLNRVQGKSRYVPNWLNSTIRIKDRNRSVTKGDSKSPDGNGTKSSNETAQN
ncbi:muscarinic acetylcholine receptor M3-like isoform X1 [Culex pipiens pallens]|uniref:muscarinic acetylcholine receptor M3-like isoform X1 n=1 Tax=Culex pipiens pallens TaxID=42434 RepID=UPI001952AC6B|nr:muscarinic acetylcholine receptor M3-like isoform X1 [Culex pipiens pallens]